MSEKEELEKELEIMRREKEIRKMLSESNIDTDFFFIEGLLSTAKMSDEGEILLKIPGSDHVKMEMWKVQYPTTEQGKRRLREPQSPQEEPRERSAYSGLFK